MYYYHSASGKWLLVRNTNEYRIRRKHLRDYWLVLMTTLMFVTPAMVIVFSLLATFLSFMYLDEVAYEQLTPIADS